jgi:hypothetical protein
MPKPMFAAVLAIAFLPPSAAGAPYPDRPGPAPPAEPVRPCLVDSLSCLRLSPRPFQPCLAALDRCGDHFALIPIGTNPRFMPADWSGSGKAARPQGR